MFSEFTKFPNILYRYKSDKQTMCVLIHILEHTQKFHKNGCKIPSVSFTRELKINDKQLKRSRDKLIEDGVISYEKTYYFWNTETLNNTNQMAGQHQPNGRTFDDQTPTKWQDNTNQMAGQHQPNGRTFENHSIYNKKKENIKENRDDVSSFSDGKKQIEKSFKKNTYAEDIFKNKIVNIYPKILSPQDYTKALNIFSSNTKMNTTHTQELIASIGWYSKCERVYNAKESGNLKFIMDLTTFLNEQWFRFASGCPSDYPLHESFSNKNFASGAVAVVCPVFGTGWKCSGHDLKLRSMLDDEQKIHFKKLYAKIKHIKQVINEKGAELVKLEKVKTMFDQREWEIFEASGAVEGVEKYNSPMQFAQNMIEDYYGLASKLEEGVA